MPPVSKLLSRLAACALAVGLTTSLVSPASAESGTGVIRGTVLETGHVIAPSIDVYLYTDTGEAVGEGTVTNSESGGYSFSGLKPGGYVLWFDNQNEAVGEWYDNSPDQAHAKVITLGAGQTFVADAYLTQFSENITRPTVSGAATVGTTLTSSMGSWYPTANITFQRQWLRGGVEIEGATLASYTLTNADAGSAISLRVTAVASGGTESAVSLSTATVTGGTTQPTPTISNVAAPSISGSTVEGSTLTATYGSWDPADATVTLQWRRGSTVVGEGPTYKTTAVDVGSSLTVRATASKVGHTGAFTDSAAHGPVTAAPPVVVAPTSTTLPTVTGTSRVGSRLMGSVGTWTGSPTYTYRWTRNGVAISGATGTSYTLKAADAAKKIAFSVTATNTAGSLTKSSSSRTIVKATSKVTVSASSSKKGRLAVKATVSSSGAKTGVMTVKVTIKGKSYTRKARLSGAKASVVLTGLKKGTAIVKVTYAGDTSTASATASKRAAVR